MSMVYIGLETDNKQKTQRAILPSLVVRASDPRTVGGRGNKFKTGLRSLVTLARPFLKMLKMRRGAGV